MDFMASKLEKFYKIARIVYYFARILSECLWTIAEIFGILLEKEENEDERKKN